MRRRLRAGGRRFAEMRHWLGIRRLGERQSSDYRAYLAVQLRRTLSKRETDPGVGALTLINRIAEEQPGGHSVLCVGCRNPLELDRFQERGFADVVGIDLFSQREDIKVMDMHALT